MTLVIVLACVAAYLVVGFRYAAPRFVTRMVESDIRQWPSLAHDSTERWRREAAGFAVVIGFVWPFYLGGVLLLNAIAKSAPLTDYELRRKSEQQARRIADLERQLGIGREARRG
jgi:hypothetical protein